MSDSVTVRIAMVCPYSLTIPGGVQSQVLGLARTLRTLGHEVRVLAPCDGAPPDPATTPLGASIPFAENGSVAPIAPDPACALRTIRALRDESFDVVHLHEPLVPGPTLTALLFTDAPLVGTFHRSGRSDVYDKFRSQVQWCADHLDIRVAVSAEAARTASSALGGDYRVTFNGIEVSRFRDAPLVPKSGPTVFFIGRHEERKGVGVLVDALPMLPSDVTVWIAGAGPLTEELKRKTAGDGRVQWLGRLTDAELASRMRSADVFVAPSLGGESFGVVLLEAMAAQTPTVCSDIPGYRAATVDGRAAHLVAPGDPSALATGLIDVLSKTELRDQLVGAGNERAQQFSMERLAEQYLSIYNEVLEVESRMARLRKPSGRWSQGVTNWTLWRHRPKRQLQENR